MWEHTLTNHNSPCDEFWHKIVSKVVYNSMKNGMEVAQPCQIFVVF